MPDSICSCKKKAALLEVFCLKTDELNDATQRIVAITLAGVNGDERALAKALYELKQHEAKQAYEQLNIHRAEHNC